MGGRERQRKRLEQWANGKGGRKVEYAGHSGGFLSRKTLR